MPGPQMVGTGTIGHREIAKAEPRDMRRAMGNRIPQDPHAAYAKHVRVMHAKGKQPMSYDDFHSRVSGSGAETEAQRARQAAEKEAKQHVVIPETKRKVPLRSLIHAGPARKAGLSLLAAGSGVGVLRYTHNADRNTHNAALAKADRRVDQAVGAGSGVAAANAASIVGGQGAKGYLTRQRGKHGETPHQQEVWANHKRKHGVTERTEAKTANAKKFKIYSKYPKELPNWRLQRLLGVKNHPLAAAGILTAGGLAGAVEAGRYHDRKVTKADSRQVEGTAAGAGIGALAAPGRTINPRGRNLHPIASLKPGVHMVDPRDLHRYARGTGIRFGERSHVAALAHSMKTTGYHPNAGPIHLNVYSDRAKISDGAHRAHAASIAGVRKVPVHIHHTTGQAPASSTRFGQLVDYARTQHQQTAYDRHHGDTDWMQRRARDTVKPGSWRDKFNRKAANTGRTVAEGGPLKTMRHGRFAAANIGLIGGGALLGSRFKKPVQKSSYTDIQARRLQRRDKTQLGLGAIEAGVAFGGLKGKSLPARLAFSAPGLAAAGMAAHDLRQDEYGWTPKTRRARHAGRTGSVGKSVEYGYQDKKRSAPRTAEMLGGLGMLAYGVPRLRMLGPAARKGVKLADKHGAGKETRAVIQLAESLGRKSNRVTGKGERFVRQNKQVDAAIASIPKSVRGEVATALGVLLAGHAHPTTTETFVPVRSGNVQ